MSSDYCGVDVVRRYHWPDVLDGGHQLTVHEDVPDVLLPGDVVELVRDVAVCSCRRRSGCVGLRGRSGTCSSPINALDHEDDIARN